MKNRGGETKTLKKGHVKKRGGCLEKGRGGCDLLTNYGPYEL